MAATVSEGTSLYAGAEAHGLYRKRPGEGRWEPLTKGLPAEPRVRALAIHPQDPQVIYAGAQDGPYRSTDGGDSWERLGFPQPGLGVWSFVFHPQDPRTMFLGTAPAAVYRSEDGGDHWGPTPMTTGPDEVTMSFPCRIIGMTIDPGRPQDLYAAIEVGGVRRSSDGGESWESVNLGLAPSEDTLDLHGVQVSAAQPGTVFISTRQGLFRSPDRGGRWEFIDVSSVSPIGYTRDLRVAPDDPNVLYVSLGKAAYSQEGALLRSPDLGRTWERIDRGFTAQATMMAVAVDGRRPQHICCCTRDGQVFGTEDGGATWTEHPLPDEVQQVRALACG